MNEGTNKQLKEDKRNHGAASIEVDLNPENNSRKPLAEANMKKVTNEETTYDQRRCYVTYCMFLLYETPLPLHTCSSPHVPRWRSL